MELRKLLNLFTEQTAPAVNPPAFDTGAFENLPPNISQPTRTGPRQGVVGSELAKTSGGQFTSRADRLNQAKVDAALGPGFKAGSKEANLALQQKFRQPQPPATAPAPPVQNKPDADAAAKKDIFAPAAPKTDAPVANTDVAPPAAGKRPGGVAFNQDAGSSPGTPAPPATGSITNSPFGKFAQAAGGQTVTTTAPPADQAVPAATTTTGQSSYTSPTGAELGAGAANQVAQSTVGPAVTSSSGAPITTGSGGTLRSRTADEIAADQKNPFGQPSTIAKKPAPDFSAGTGKDLGQGSYGGPNKTTTPAPVSEEEIEEELQEAFNDMLRLSGLQLNEKAVSKQQQKFMGMVHAMQKGEKIKGASPELKKVAKTMGKKDAKDFASTKHKGLPKKVTEGLNVMLDEEGHTLEHIVNRFKHEAKTFLNTGEMSDNLYDALYDYYVDRGEMPYGIAKAREGDPYTWVAARFEADIDGTVDVKMPLGEVGGDDTLNELARLAGLSESRVDECGDMGMDMEDRLNVSTNMSSDGTKSVNISAQGEKAEELLAMLKLAGMGGDRMSQPAIVAISSDDEMMEEERETEYANTPEEEYQTVASITRQGNDLNREKKQFAGKPRLGDNPMAEGQMELDRDLIELLDSVLIKEAEPRRPKGDTGQAEIFTADLGIQPPSPDEGPVAKPKAPATPKAPVVTPGIKR